MNVLSCSPFKQIRSLGIVIICPRQYIWLYLYYNFHLGIVYILMVLYGIMIMGCLCISSGLVVDTGLEQLGSHHEWLDFLELRDRIIIELQVRLET